MKEIVIGIDPSPEIQYSLVANLYYTYLFIYLFLSVKLVLYKKGKILEKPCVETADNLQN